MRGEGGEHECEHGCERGACHRPRHSARTAADDDEAVEHEVLDGGSGLGQLLGALDLVAPGAQHVEAALVAEARQLVGPHLLVGAVHDPAGAVQEAQQRAAGMAALQVLVEADDDVVPARGLAAGEDHAHAEGRARGRVGGAGGGGRQVDQPEVSLAGEVGEEGANVGVVAGAPADVALHQDVGHCAGAAGGDGG